MRREHIEIAGRTIGPGHPVFVVAELSANHNGSFERAAEIVHAAGEAGADAIKLQTYTADSMTLDLDHEPFVVGGGTLWDGQSLYQLYREAQTPWDWHPRLQDLAQEVGLVFFSTPFDTAAVDFLEGLDVPAHKVASFELIDLPLIRTIAATGKPMILSTGMANREEIGEAVTAAREAGATDLALLQCTSSYPAPISSANLRTIPDLARSFGVPAGLSDHTLGTTVPVAAVALGATLLEKHLTISRKDRGPDSAFSLEPDEFAAMVRAVRDTEEALGEPSYGPSDSEAAGLRFRRSLFAVETIEEGEPFTSETVRSIRPAGGLAPKHLETVLTRRATRRISRGTPLSWELIEGGEPGRE